jgi:hypothetical protein
VVEVCWCAGVAGGAMDVAGAAGVGWTALQTMTLSVGDIGPYQSSARTAHSDGWNGLGTNSGS